MLTTPSPVSSSPRHSFPFRLLRLRARSDARSRVRCHQSAGGNPGCARLMAMGGLLTSRASPRGRAVLLGLSPVGVLRARCLSAMEF